MPSSADRVLVRPLTSADALAFQTLRLFGLRESPFAFGSSFEEASRIPLEETERRLGIPADCGVVVGGFAGDELVAMGGVKRFESVKEKHKAWIWGMYVYPDFRRRGLGRKIMEALLASAAALDGLALVKISVESSNVAAKKLYVNFGFRSFGTEPKALLVEGEFRDEDHLVLEMAELRRSAE
jgi:ribosomal protein S18 acetylase RimI-like enzyme